MGKGDWEESKVGVVRAMLLEKMQLELRKDWLKDELGGLYDSSSGSACTFTIIRLGAGWCTVDAAESGDFLKQGGVEPKRGDCFD